MGPSYPSLLLMFLSKWLLLAVRAPLPVVAVATVSQLPGFSGPLPFHLETGYVVVDDVSDSQLFYYFVASERNPAKDPLILWLTGGPGCSALSGLAFEIGPFSFEIVQYNGSLPTLVHRPYSWTKIANIIFLDSPIGTGFSFSRTYEDLVIGDTTSYQHVNIFLKKWFNDHPEFLTNQLYIAGDSYAGKMVPIITHAISEGIQSRHYPPLNLQGYMIGNPVINKPLIERDKVTFAHSFGLLSFELYKSIIKECEGDDYANPSKSVCAQELEKFGDMMSTINYAQILEPKCDDVTYVKHEDEGKRYMLEHLHGFQQTLTFSDLMCREYAYYLCQEWANFEITKKALQIQQGTIKSWIRCNITSYMEDIANATEYLSLLAMKGYRALVYSGDHDMNAPFLATDESIRSFNWSVVDDWRPWMVDGQTAGFTRTYSSKLTFATVKGAGHTAPEYKPKECLTMISRWLSVESL